ncbi:MAG: YceD family protein [Bdellovibrionaceae bacterium]|nr:YceD family protein [Pseudobdellovibrionaceae bacterium]MDW8190732.1 YceD family protein [Pseudobdellovibrionaceae bacterium]
MKLRLLDIPREGAQFSYKRGDDADLDLALHDILENQNYLVTFSLRPLDQNGTFDLKGQMKTQWEEHCSRCAEPFLFPLDLSFHEVLIPKISPSLYDSSPHKPHHMEIHDHNGLTDAYEYENDLFHVGEFLHELLVVSRPVAPEPPLSSDNTCLHCGLNPSSICLRKESSPTGKSFNTNQAFSVLKKMFK